MTWYSVVVLGYPTRTDIPWVRAGAPPGKSESETLAECVTRASALIDAGADDARVVVARSRLDARLTRYEDRRRVAWERSRTALL